MGNQSTKASSEIRYGDPHISSNVITQGQEQQQQHLIVNEVPNQDDEGNSKNDLSTEGDLEDAYLDNISITNIDTDTNFVPSYSVYTPAVTPANIKKIKYRSPDKRSPTYNNIAPRSSYIDKPNTQDAIKRVSVVIHKHIGTCERRLLVSGEKERESGLFYCSKMQLFAEENFLCPRYRYNFFHSGMSSLGSGNLYYTVDKVPEAYHIPNLDEIYVFILNLYVKGQLSSECLIVSLIYIERLMETAHVPIVAITWRPIVLAGLLLASKVQQDIPSCNIEFSEICPQYSVSAIKSLESLVCSQLNWNLYIKSSEYAKYYFALRSLSEQKNFRRRYNMFVKVAPPNADKIQKMTSNIQDHLSRSL